MKNSIVSSLPPLQPNKVWDIKTGEEIFSHDYTQPITHLLTHINMITTEYYRNHKEILHGLSYKKVYNPAEYARQNNITVPLNLPVTVKVQSRVQRLVRHKLVSEIASYVNNSNTHKKEPSFSPKINLGAIDSHMATLSKEDNILTLQWKVWDKEYLIEFIIPSYILNRNVIKYSLPVVQLSKKTGEPVFYFTIQEQPATNLKNTLRAGIDLGRKEPYTLVITTPDNRRVAHYTTSGRLNQLNQKRERLIVEKKQVYAKAKQYEQLGLNPNILWSEYSYKRNKVTRLGLSIASQLGAEINRKLDKHKLNTVHVEDLSWVTGAKYGSKWNHSTQQASITHSLARIGVSVKKINPKNTSQKCYKCDVFITHNTKKRSVHCIKCKTILDRDFNAAMNIAKTNPYPNSQRAIGDNPSDGISQVIEVSLHKSYIKTKLPSFTT